MANFIIKPNQNYLLPTFDQAIIEVSEYSRYLSPIQVALTQSLEIRLCALFMSGNESVLVTRTFIEESVATRIALFENKEIVESGFVRLFTNKIDSYDEKNAKREGYGNVRHVPKYFYAWFDNSREMFDYSIFDLVPKNFDAGSLAHQIWLDTARQEASSFMLEEIVEDAITVIAHRDTGNSTWESTETVLRSSLIPPPMWATLRARSFSSYADAHRANGINLVTGSRIANVLFTGRVPSQDFDLGPCRNFVETFGIADDLVRATPKTILQCRQELILECKGNRPLDKFHHCYEKLSERISKYLRLGKVREATKNIKQSNVSIQKRHFKVALSFPGKFRDVVEDVYAELLSYFDVNEVFYDRTFQAELAIVDLDLLLQDIYEHRCDLLIVFLASAYRESEWCGIEWRSIRELIKRRKAQGLMLARLEEFDRIEGLFSLDGYIDVRETGARNFARYAKQRYDVLG